jgi:hypothetical protein
VKETKWEQLNQAENSHRKECPNKLTFPGGTISLARNHGVDCEVSHCHGSRTHFRGTRQESADRFDQLQGGEALMAKLDGAFNPKILLSINAPVGRGCRLATAKAQCELSRSIGAPIKLLAP